MRIENDGHIMAAISLISSSYVSPGVKNQRVARFRFEVLDGRRLWLPLRTGGVTHIVIVTFIRAFFVSVPARVSVAATSMWLFLRVGASAAVGRSD